LSHFTKIKTAITDVTCLKRALDTLQFSYSEGQGVVKGWMGNTETAGLVVHANDRYDIGFRTNAETYEIVADWWGVEHSSSIRQQTFADQVMQQYAYHKTVQELEERGLSIVQQTVTAEHVIELTVNW